MNEERRPIEVLEKDCKPIKAVFHKWICDYTTVSAIVELETGVCAVVSITDFKFSDRPGGLKDLRKIHPES